MTSSVFVESRRVRKSSLTHRTLKGPVTGVRVLVGGKVAGLPERLVADIARERTYAGVRAHVTTQVAGLGEALAATRTTERLVGEIVRGLGVLDEVCSAVGLKSARCARQVVFNVLI